MCNSSFPKNPMSESINDLFKEMKNNLITLNPVKQLGNLVLFVVLFFLAFLWFIFIPYCLARFIKDISLKFKENEGSSEDKTYSLISKIPYLILSLVSSFIILFYILLLPIVKLFEYLNKTIESYIN